MTEYLTASVPGIGGRLRHTERDFLVEEIPLYDPCGRGDHLYLWVEKCGLTTFDLLRQLSLALDCKERDIGYAGLKDARAISRQMVSVPLRTPSDVSGLQLRGIQVLEAKLHTNKLRPGHLAGNQFKVRIREVGSEAAKHAEMVFGTLADVGVPNRFGHQRYGALENSHLIGQAILRGDFEEAVSALLGNPDRITHAGWREAVLAYREGDFAKAVQSLPRHCANERRVLTALMAGKRARQAVLALPRKLLRLYLSAYQSSLFDRMIDMRLASIERLWPGDLAYKHANGACFLVTDPVAEQPRADQFEISATGPLFGYKVRLAEGQTGLLERSLLDKEGLCLENFRLSGGLSMVGERRPLRVPLTEHSVLQEKGDLVLSFRLPKGSFATAVLGEIMKTD